ncbi:autotransporter-associated beta strand repeat-containing protein, partial [Ralstonia pseudosolanacearum]|uniref:autotransporter-associated beta strand repeat-containing protein n=1 Tax=Ralstonia pseudosolanacearum TaxID=1310165 RepID=UPI003D2907B3
LTTARGRVGGKVSEQYGWGLPDLKAAMEGPGELLRDNLVSIPAGWEDSWSNDISQAALQQRKAEDALELQEWDEKEQRAKQYRANGQTEIADSAEQELVLLRNRIDYLRARQKDPHGYEAGLTKAGDGRLILSGNNSYTGGTALLEGTLGVGSATALGTGTLDIHDGATLLSTANDLTLANAITVKGRGVVDTQANTFTLSGDITDDAAPGGFVKAGSGALVLSGINTYSGPTSVAMGTLQAGSTSGFSSRSSFVVNDGAKLDLNNFNQTVGS